MNGVNAGQFYVVEWAAQVKSCISNYFWLCTFVCVLGLAIISGSTSWIMHYSISILNPRHLEQIGYKNGLQYKAYGMAYVILCTK